MFYETLIGSKAGDCDFIRNDRDNWIQTITVRHDGNAIRSIQVISSNGTVTTFGRTDLGSGLMKLKEE